VVSIIPFEKPGVLPGADTINHADAPLRPQHSVFDRQALPAVLIDNKARRAFAKRAGTRSAASSSASSSTPVLVTVMCA